MNTHKEAVMRYLMALVLALASSYAVAQTPPVHLSVEGESTSWSTPVALEGGGFIQVEPPVPAPASPDDTALLFITIQPGMDYFLEGVVYQVWLETKAIGPNGQQTIMDTSLVGLMTPPLVLGVNESCDDIDLCDIAGDPLMVCFASSCLRSKRCELGGQEYCIQSFADCSHLNGGPLGDPNCGCSNLRPACPGDPWICEENGDCYGEAGKPAPVCRGGLWGTLAFWASDCVYTVHVQKLN